jgi:hypothetical protein
MASKDQSSWRSPGMRWRRVAAWRRWWRGDILDELGKRYLGY